MFFSRRVVPHTPPSFVKFSARARGVMIGAGTSVPSNDHVPELMKALLWPMLDNKFLKHPGVGVKLMLPIELTRFIEREERDFYQRARLDKQNMIPSLEWSGEALYDLANARVRCCGIDGRQPSLRSLLDESITDQRLIDAFRSLLQDKKKGLAEAYIKNKTYGRLTEDEGTQDLADKASNAYTKEFLYSLSNTDREVLQKVDEALMRIDRGEFGTCAECGKELNRKRLAAVPWASHCVTCQEKIEKGLL